MEEVCLRNNTAALSSNHASKYFRPSAWVLCRMARMDQAAVSISSTKNVLVIKRPPLSWRLTFPAVAPGVRMREDPGGRSSRHRRKARYYQNRQIGPVAIAAFRPHVYRPFRPHLQLSPGRAFFHSPRKTTAYPATTALSRQASSVLDHVASSYTRPTKAQIR